MLGYASYYIICNLHIYIMTLSHGYMINTFQYIIYSLTNNCRWYTLSQQNPHHNIARCIFNILVHVWKKKQPVHTPTYKIEFCSSVHNLIITFRRYTNELVNKYSQCLYANKLSSFKTGNSIMLSNYVWMRKKNGMVLSE